MFNLNKVKEQLHILPDSVGEGSFGCVHLCLIDNKKYAIKCEDKTKGTILSLLKEFKMCRRIYNIQKYLIDKNEDDNTSILIYNHIVNNNILNIPDALSIHYLRNNKIIPEPKTYYECEDYNLLTMDLCGINFEQILENYKLTEKCKYYIAFHLLLIMSCIHRTGIIHRDMKLANLVISGDIDSENLKIILIDMGLAKEFYTYENGKVVNIKPKKATNITGTIRYLSLNIHEYNSPSIVDDLIGMCYMLINIFTERDLPWVGFKKDEKKFDRTKHTPKHCKCKYHENIEKGYHRNTIAEVKFHISLNKLCDGYGFLKEWLMYLYSLNIGQMPSYNILLNILLKDKQFIIDNKLEFIKK
jgi:serine/threonine protein kinase